MNLLADLTKEQKRTLITLSIAVIPALIAVIFRMHWIIGMILCLLSCIVTVLEMINPLKIAVTEKRFTDPLLIITAAGVISFVSGAYKSAALMLIIYSLSVLIVTERRKRAGQMAKTRAELSSLKAYTAQLEDKPAFKNKLYVLTDKYLTYALLIIAVLYAILVPLLTNVTALKALQKAAVIISVSGAFSIFAPFTLIDFSTAARAAECGILFRQGALNKLSNTRLLYSDIEEPSDVGGLKVSAADPNMLTAKSVLFLAATAYSSSKGEISRRLAQAYEKPIDTSAVTESQEIEGLGVVAKIRGTTVCAGSAVFMNRIGLNIMPFSDFGKVIHVGVNGRYAGRIYLDYKDISGSAFEHEINNLNLSLAYTASGVGETGIIYASGKEFPTCLKPDIDVKIIPGAYGDGADIYTETETRKTLINTLSLAQGADALKKGCFVLSVVLKIFVLVLALIGFMPVWIAVGLDAAAAMFTCSYSLRALDMEERLK